MTFLNSNKYKEESLKTKAAVCITSLNLSKFLPKNVLSLMLKMFFFSYTCSKNVLSKSRY